MRRRPLLIVPAVLWLLTPIMLLASSAGDKVYLRNLIFSEIYDDRDFPGLRTLERFLSGRIKYDKAGDLAAASNSPAEYQALLNRARTSVNSQAVREVCAQVSAKYSMKLSHDDCLAIRIAFAISDKFMGVRCGLDESLSKRFLLIQKGVGCCSDFNEAFAIQASILGLKTREVNNHVHTTSEYYDRSVKRWKWIGTSYRTLIIDNKGQIMGAYAIRASNPWDRVVIVDIPPYDSQGFSTDRYAGHSSAKNSLQFWNLNANPAYVYSRERWLLQLGFPREIVQVFSLLTGVRLGYLYLASPYAAWALSLLQLVIRILILLWVAFPLTACVYFVSLCAKLKSSGG